MGQLETVAIESFWKALAESSHLNISLFKLRGENAHHIVEASFKAFSRALRNYLDTPDIWFPHSLNDQLSIQLHREGMIQRQTKETRLSVHLLLNGESTDTHIETGIPMLDQFYTILAQEANMTLTIQCHGDLWIDDHHTAEDVSIALGQCLSQALGDKAGLNRMWVGEASIERSSTTTTTGTGAGAGAGASDGHHNDSSNNVNTTTTTTTKLSFPVVQVTMDLSNRPCLVHNLHHVLGGLEYIMNDGNNNDTCPLTCEMLVHSLDSLVMNGHMTVHVIGMVPSVVDVVLGTAKAFGRALRVCAMVDQRRAGMTASSKGTLSA